MPHRPTLRRTVSDCLPIGSAATPVPMDHHLLLATFAKRRWLCSGHEPLQDVQLGHYLAHLTDDHADLRHDDASDERKFISGVLAGPRPSSNRAGLQSGE